MHGVYFLFIMTFYHRIRFIITLSVVPEAYSCFLPFGGSFAPLGYFTFAIIFTALISISMDGPNVERLNT